jgi:hypothetical protein
MAAFVTFFVPWIVTSATLSTFKETTASEQALSIGVVRMELGDLLKQEFARLLGANLFKLAQGQCEPEQWSHLSTAGWALLMFGLRRVELEACVTEARGLGGGEVQVSGVTVATSGKTGDTWFLPGGKTIRLRTSTKTVNVKIRAWKRNSPLADFSLNVAIGHFERDGGGVLYSFVPKQRFSLPAHGDETWCWSFWERLHKAK